MGTINRTTRDLNNRTRSTLRLSAPEAIIGDSTYRSPETNVEQLDSGLTENIDYTSGSAVYTGEDTIQIKLTSIISVSSGSAGTVVHLTGGINLTPDTTQEQTNTLTNANDVKVLISETVHIWETGDTLDFYIKATNNITLEKAEWIIERYDR